ncbi:hypothetical protein Sa4125_03090 [Aureimonas sp. SA4125]|uniref:histidine kinase dimerization/phospho-acceptor domain-containing protein n=1 Tax=Aureimonas sp. SA4125 TaxID=2826993 RepID=UPI001CC3364B|nr:histidine kinase dimerization/phospho-acceptor domain-containing protein [Aureimonas sp. SA4125]BDA82767.1 hypothetical protein Sa4125_03090 [Aureimonas sp. SA4125]
MSISRGFSPLDIMTLGEFRGANEAGDGLVVLPVTLDEVLWSNKAGHALLGLSGDGSPLEPKSGLSRQIKATARLIETRGEARLLLRPATGLAAQPLVADLKRIETAEGMTIVVLAAAAPRKVAQPVAALAERLLAESGLKHAAIHGSDGALVAGVAAPEGDADLAAEIAALIASGVPQQSRSEGRLALARVAEGLVLVQRLPPTSSWASATDHEAPAAEDASPVAAAAPASEVPVSEGVTGGSASAEIAAGSAETPAATSMSAIVRRWHSRGMPDGLAPAWRPADAPSPPEGSKAQGPTIPLDPASSSAEASVEEARETAPSIDPEAMKSAAPAELRDAETQDAAPPAVAPGFAPAATPLVPSRRRSAWGSPVATLPVKEGKPEPEGDATLSADVAEGGTTIDATTPIEPEMPDEGAPEQPRPFAADLPEARADPIRRAGPLRSLWGAPVAVQPSASGDSETPSPSREPGASEPMPAEIGTGNDASPNDDRAGGGDETAQPVESEAPVVVPDIAPERAGDLDAVTTEDAEAPAEEDLYPTADERDEPESLAVDAPDDVPPGPVEMATVGPFGEAGDPVSGEGEESSVADEDLTMSDPADDDAALVDALPAAAAEPVLGGRGFAPSFSGAPVRFVWQIDRDGKFRSLTPEFSAAVGPRAADVAGRSFREVADVFGFDLSGEISRLLERRDTWSGRSILWPVEASDRKVPVDLAALPVYARDRSFDGFRGFGIVRMNESVPDPDGIGLILADVSAFAPPIPDEPAILVGDAEEASGQQDRPVLTTFEAPSPAAFGRRVEPPAPVETGDAQPDDGRQDGAPKVIRLEERRRPRDGSLSLAEEAAFRAIGMTLGRERPRPSPPETTTLDVLPAPAELDVVGDEAKTPLQSAPVSPSAEPDESVVGEPETEIESLHAGDAAAPDRDALSHRSGKTDVPTDAEDGRGSSSFQLAENAGGVVTEADAPSGTADVRDELTEATDDAGDGSESTAQAVAAELEAIFATLPLPVLVQMNETLIYANREFEDLTGYAALGILEAAGGLDALFAEPAEANRQGELAIRRSNGQISDVRVHMQRVTFGGRSCLLMSFSPSPREIAAVTAPERPSPPADADLRQQVEELQAVLDTATDGIVLLDPAGTIRAMNGSAHALFGIGEDVSVGQHLSSLFAPESQKATLDYLDMLREDGLAGILNDGREVVGRVAQGGSIPLFITIGRLSGERGWCVVIRDIAHWKRIEEDLVNARRQAEAASLHKSRFLANISHELRTPLNAIIGFADVMASECFGPIGNERYIEYLGDIKRSGHHVLDLVNDLLDISKIEAGRLDLAFEAVSLNEVISEVVSLMQPQANRERVIVRSNLPSSVPPVVADRRTMRQIALNLIANAIRFTPAGGQIIASTTYTADGEVLLRFRDSGIGMSEHEIEIALTPFQQVHPPGATRGEGTGLGLPLTKAMVEANRANFAISSAPGEGTLVEIAFPSQRVLAD